MRNLFLILALTYSSFSFAINQGACSKLLNDGLYKRYEYAGIDQPLTKATKRHGSSKGTSATSTEATTAILDPKYWSNVSTSETQSTSSTGECNLFGLNQLKEQRDMYIAQNRDEVMSQIVAGKGEHVNVIASLSLCDNNQFSNFSHALKTETVSLIKSHGKYSSTIDQAIKLHGLEKKCHIFN